MIRVVRLLQLFICSLLLVGIASAQDQDVRFERLTIDQGLSQNTVFTILPDRMGYLWFGTMNGLNLYDGYRFHHYKNDIKDPASLSFNYVGKVAEDDEGSIWVGTSDGGVNRLDRATQRFKVYRVDGSANGLIDDHILALTIGKNDLVWVGTPSGLNSINIKTGQVKAYFAEGRPGTISNSKVISLLSDHTGTLWVGTDKGLNRYDADSDSFTTVPVTATDGQSVGEEAIGMLYADLDNFIWIATKQGLHRLDLKSNTIKRVGGPEEGGALADLTVTSMGQDRNRHYWIGTTNGLRRMSPDHVVYAAYTNDKFSPVSLSNNYVNTLTIDRAGIVWVGTVDGGVNKYDPQRYRFKVVRNEFNRDDIITDNSVTAFCYDHSGALWVGTVAGLNRYDADGRHTVYRHNPADPESLDNDRIKALFADSNGMVWVFTNNGVNIYNRETDNFRPRPQEQELLSRIRSLVVFSVLEDRNKNLWLGCSGGVVKLDSARRTVRYYNSESEPRIGSRRYMALCEDRDGHIWLATLGSGLARLDPVNEKVTVYRNDANRPTSLCSNRIYSLLCAADGTVWIGTPSGLCRFNRAREDFTTFTEHNGLANNNIYGLLQDSVGDIWMSTDGGLSKYTPFTNLFKTYDVNDGLQSNEFNVGAYYKSAQGELFFGGINGFNRFSPVGVRNNENVPTTVITAFQAFNASGAVAVKKQFLFNVDTFELPYYHNTIVIEFAALNFTNTHKNRYAYKLDNADPYEVITANERQARYVNLPPGEYLFHVSGSNNDGLWSNGEATLLIIIKPPFWRTWPAYLFYVLAALGLILGGHRWRLRVLERRNYELEQVVIKRTEELNKKNGELEEKNKELADQNIELIESHKRADRIFSALAEALPGTLLDGKYRLEDKIGVGGFGVVYRATHLALKREIAVKVFRPAPGNDSAEALARFQFEAISACRINHPNAVMVLDSGISADGIAYLVMELLQGHTLEDELRQQGTLSIERCAQILVPVCDVLEKAHAAGLIHRDIKPDNIFLHQTEKGEIVKVVDFGIAKLMELSASMNLDLLTANDKIIGTPVYIAPERLESKPYDGRADVYSVGVMIYRILSGRLPYTFEKGNMAELFTQKLLQEPKSLGELNNEIPSELSQIVMRTLVKDAGVRPTAAELKEEFLRAADISPSAFTASVGAIIDKSYNITECTTETSTKLYGRTGEEIDNKPERWRQIEEIFYIAAEMSPEEADSYLERMCGDDQALKSEVAALLAADNRATTNQAFDSIMGSVRKLKRDLAEKREE